MVEKGENMTKKKRTMKRMTSATIIITLGVIISTIIAADNTTTATATLASAPSSEKTDLVQLCTAKFPAFKTQFSRLYIQVLYQSETTFVLQAPKLVVLPGPDRNYETIPDNEIVENPCIWVAVDWAKQQGYISIDAVTLSGQGTSANAHLWQVIMSIGR
jgi:hypothetical protein